MCLKSQPLGDGGRGSLIQGQSRPQSKSRQLKLNSETLAQKQTSSSKTRLQANKH